MIDNDIVARNPHPTSPNDSHADADRYPEANNYRDADPTRGKNVAESLSTMADLEPDISIESLVGREFCVPNRFV